ncbi:pentapeptide repeat-containing protein [Paractinoplanes deccanensis]|uniref:pentapeptide repeat-containing protein n=1 Tax=Paractinoplanes deccanensis TaxID=113561 RepID=UPI00194378D9|nr:pentapeptide repeat-containing protein [Actinoplanes deccanensis]
MPRSFKWPPRWLFSWRAVAAVWAAAPLLIVVLRFRRGDFFVMAFALRVQAASFWTVPCAAALAFTLFVVARRRLPSAGRRLCLAAGTFVAAYLGLGFAGFGRAALTALVLTIAGLLAAWIVVLPRRLAPALPASVIRKLGDRDRIELGDARLKLQNDMRGTALQSIAGLAVLAGAVIALQQLGDDRQQAREAQELTRQGQVSDRFSRAVDQLGSDRIEVRLGGIHTLVQVSEQDGPHEQVVFQVLASYLRRAAAPSPKRSPAKPRPLAVRAPDCQAALNALIEPRGGPGTAALDLSGLDLSGAEIRGRYYPGADGDYRMAPADLVDADFRGTDLRGATFETVYLLGSRFAGADLRGADFARADMSLHDEEGIEYDFWMPGGSGLKTIDFSGARTDSTTKGL